VRRVASIDSCSRSSRNGILNIPPVWDRLLGPKRLIGVRHPLLRLDRKKPPPPWGFPIYVLPSRTVSKRTPLEEPGTNSSRGSLLLTVLDEGTVIGNPPGGGGGFSISLVQGLGWVFETQERKKENISSVKLGNAPVLQSGTDSWVLRRVPGLGQITW